MKCSERNFNRKGTKKIWGAFRKIDFQERQIFNLVGLSIAFRFIKNIHLLKYNNNFRLINVIDSFYFALGKKFLIQINSS